MKRTLEALQIPFDVTDVDPYSGITPPLAAGKYLSEITEMEPGGDDSNWYVRMKWEVLEGELKGSTFTFFLPLGGSEQQAEIAWKQVSAVAHAVGMLTGNDLTDLAFKPHMMEIGLDPERTVTDENTGEDKVYKARNRFISATPAPIEERTASGVKKVGATAGTPSKPPLKSVSKPPAKQEAEQQEDETGNEEGEGDQEQAAAPAKPAAAGGKAPPWKNKK